MQYTSVNRQAESIPVVCRMGRTEQCLKRLFDIVFSFLGLLLSFPLILCIAIALKMQGIGSVFYKQERIGLGGKPFWIIKFRTMTLEAEQNGPQLECSNDPRLTPVGKFLRNHHLDELPQFWNVIMGDMSMVGPRPERRFFIDKIMKEDPRYECLFAVRPGITSEAALYNGYTATIEKMLERLSMDLHYMETATLWNDFCVIVKTADKLIRGENNKNDISEK